MRRYLGGGPGHLRRLELGQLCRAHRDRDRGLVERSQVFFGASAHVTVRERTPPPHVTGHCKDGKTHLRNYLREGEKMEAEKAQLQLRK